MNDPVVVVHYGKYKNTRRHHHHQDSHEPVVSLTLPTNNYRSIQRQIYQFGRNSLVLEPWETKIVVPS